MPKKKTQEEYAQQVNEKASHIIVTGVYNGNRTPIEHYCLKHNIAWNVSPFNFLNHPNGCPECQREILSKYYKSRMKTDEQFNQEVDTLDTGIKPMSEYSGYNNIIPFMCKMGHIWDSTPHAVLDGYGCPYCAGQKILVGFNDLWTTDPDIAKMLSNPNIGYEISRGSKRVVSWTCPRCGERKMSSVKQVITYGLACSACSDGISYPNKFMYNILLQLGIDFQREVNKATCGFEWTGKYKYDFYFEIDHEKFFIEMDGGFHYDDYFSSYEEIHNIDEIKDSLAAEHGINMIRVDCNYINMNHRFEYIKQSILDSKINQILNLTNINWEKCDKEALKSYCIEAAKQYDDGVDMHKIAINLGVSYSTVYTWLKILGEKGLCTYKPVYGAPKKK